MFHRYNMKDPFNEIRALANASPSTEVCGFLLWDGRIEMSVSPAHNISDNPSEQVEIHPEDTKNAYKSQRMLAIYHSHTVISEPKFSEMDVAYSDTLDLPMFMYSLRTDSFYFYRSRESVPPLVGRQFIIGYSDCASLVTDYYLKNFAIRIPFVERTLESMRSGLAKTGDVLCNNGFQIVKGINDLKTGDILAFKVGGSSDINHVGIHEGNGWLLHHPFNSSSLVTRIPSDWSSSMTVFRRENL